MMSRSVMDLKDVCLELCAGGILMKALKFVNLPNYRSLDPGVGRTLKVPPPQKVQIIPRQNTLKCVPRDHQSTINESSCALLLGIQIIDGYFILTF